MLLLFQKEEARKSKYYVTMFLFLFAGGGGRHTVKGLSCCEVPVPPPVEEAFGFVLLWAKRRQASELDLRWSVFMFIRQRFG